MNYPHNHVRLIIIALFGFMITGCAHNYEQSGLKSSSTVGLDSCIAKITSDNIIKHASMPDEKVALSEGELWIYDYEESRLETVIRGTGDRLFPFESDTKRQKYTLRIGLLFDNQGMFTDWSYVGQISKVRHHFETLSCP